MSMIFRFPYGIRCQFYRRFDATYCKYLLEKTMQDIEKLRDAKLLKLLQMRNELALLLHDRRDAAALVKVEQVIKDDSKMLALDKIKTYCAEIARCIPAIAAQRACPSQLQGAIHSLCYAASWWTELPRLPKLESQFTAKYGRDFICAAVGLGSVADDQLKQLLSTETPSMQKKLEFLRAIANEHNITWDPVDEHNIT